MGIYLLLVIGAIIGILVYKSLEKDNRCPQCGRPLVPGDHSGFYPKERPFCRYCGWRFKNKVR